MTHVFYEQYLTIVPEGLFNISLCLLPTFVVCCLLLMDLRSGLLNLLTIVMITVDTVGVMTLWGIDYNAVALINLVTVRARRFPPRGGLGGVGRVDDCVSSGFVECVRTGTPFRRACLPLPLRRLVSR